MLYKTPALTSIHLRQSNSHDVGLVYSSDPTAAFLPGHSKSIVSNPEGIVSGDDLETFHYPGHTLRKRQGGEGPMEDEAPLMTRLYYCDIVQSCL